MNTQIPKESTEVKHGKLVCPPTQMSYPVEECLDMKLHEYLTKRMLNPQLSLLNSKFNTKHKPYSKTILFVFVAWEKISKVM